MVELYFFLRFKYDIVEVEDSLREIGYMRSLKLDRNMENDSGIGILFSDPVKGVFRVNNSRNGSAQQFSEEKDVKSLIDHLNPYKVTSGDSQIVYES